MLLVMMVFFFQCTCVDVVGVRTVRIKMKMVVVYGWFVSIVTFKIPLHAVMILPQNPARFSRVLWNQAGFGGRII